MSRNLFGERLFRDFWNEGDEPESRWPCLAIGAAVVIIIAVGILA